MLVVETIAKIRRAHFVDGKSIKQICRELRLSRNTVCKPPRSGKLSPHLMQKVYAEAGGTG